MIVPHITKHGLRLIAWAWAVWAWLTASAYTYREPGMLDPVSAWLPLDLGWTWAVVAVALTLGTVLPLNGRIGAVARVLLSVGAVLLVALLGAFTVSFLMGGGRGWVSAKNYGALCFAALLSSKLFGHGHGVEKWKN